MGGGQALNFGLAHLDTFAQVGGFSSTPNSKRPSDLVKAPSTAAKKLKQLSVSCNGKDGVFWISGGVHKMLDENDVPHVYLPRHSGWRTRLQSADMDTSSLKTACFAGFKNAQNRTLRFHRKNVTAKKPDFGVKHLSAQRLICKKLPRRTVRASR